MRTRYAKKDEMDCILLALTSQNRLACEVMLRTGLRISDVLALKTKDLQKPRISIKEMKTGKRRIFTLPTGLKKELAFEAGRVFIFEHRTNQFKSRTRQAVWKDVVRASRALGLKNVAPHSTRKIYAVRKYNACGNIEKVKELLNHGDVTVTMLYAMADQMNKRNRKRKNAKKQSNLV